MNTQRFFRCLRLVSLVQSRVGYGAAELARELDVSNRTVYRDIRMLQEGGIPVRYDEGKAGYILEPHFSLKTPPLTGDELVALLLAAHMSFFSADQALGRVVRQSIGKILAQVPAHIREEAIRLLKSCVIESPFTLGAKGEKRVCSEIIMAIRRRRQVRISYRQTNESEQLIQTRIAPYRLVASPEGWRVVGRSSVHRGIYCFDLQRIQRAEMTEDTYDLPQKYRRQVPVSDLIQK